MILFAVLPSQIMRRLTIDLSNSFIFDRFAVTVFKICNVQFYPAIVLEKIHSNSVYFKIETT